MIITRSFCILVNQDKDAKTACASRILYEYTLSERETDVSRAHIRDRIGRKHTTTQVFTVLPEPEYRDRGAGYLQETLFVPHKFIQTLDEQQHVQLGRKLIALER